MSDEAQAALLELEQRVTAKLQAALPKWDLPDDPLEGWKLAASIEPLPGDVPQFPREQWVIQPARRAQALVLADRLIDIGNLTEAGWLVYYGGKMRIS